MCNLSVILSQFAMQFRPNPPVACTRNRRRTVAILCILSVASGCGSGRSTGCVWILCAIQTHHGGWCGSWSSVVLLPFSGRCAHFVKVNFATACFEHGNGLREFHIETFLLLLMLHSMRPAGANKERFHSILFAHLSRGFRTNDYSHAVFALF